MQVNNKACAINSQSTQVEQRGWLVPVLGAILLPVVVDVVAVQ